MTWKSLDLIYILVFVTSVPHCKNVVADSETNSASPESNITSTESPVNSTNNNNITSENASSTQLDPHANITANESLTNATNTELNVQTNGTTNETSSNVNGTISGVNSTGENNTVTDSSINSNTSLSNNDSKPIESNNTTETSSGSNATSNATNIQSNSTVTESQLDTNSSSNETLSNTNATNSGSNDTSSEIPSVSNMTSNQTDVQSNGTTTDQTTDSNNTSQVDPNANVTTNGTALENGTVPDNTTAESNNTKLPDITTVSSTLPTTTTKQPYIVQPIYLSLDNAIIQIQYKLQFIGCSHTKSSLESELSAVPNDVDGCKYVLINNIDGCTAVRRRKRSTSSETTVDVSFGVDSMKATSTNTTIGTDVYNALNNISSVNKTFLTENKDEILSSFSSKEACDSDICKHALIGKPGYVCRKEIINSLPKCAIKYYCDVHSVECRNGECYVESEMQSSGITKYVSKCRCYDQRFYTYEGTTCEKAVMKWELAVAITGGAAGLIILILIFVICMVCCRRSSQSSDVSFEESELIYQPSGITSVSQYNGRYNDRSQKQGVENRTYVDIDQVGVSQRNSKWKPEDSAKTYAQIDSKLRESNYNMQIKRPQVFENAANKNMSGL